jgi:hypothetical protein
LKRGLARERYLSVVRKTNIAEAARGIGMSRAGIYDDRKRDPEFAQLWDSAVEEAADH